MRNRHHPRLCRSCTAPLACQENTCWRCGSVVEEERGDKDKGAIDIPAPARVHETAVHDDGELNRWLDEGGSV
jgi:hypothetical protein